jgi:outer membrane protein
MKKRIIFTVVLFLFTGIFAFAQVEKGNWLFGGSSTLEFNTSKEKIKTGGTTNDGSTYTDFDIRPQIGYFVIDKLPIGLMLDIDIDKEKYTDPDSEYKWTSFMVGPFVRYYFIDLEGLMPYAEASMGIGSGNTKTNYMGSESDDKYGTFAYGFGAGATYFITDNVGVDLFIGYANCQEKYAADDESARSEDDDVVYKYGGLDFNIGFIISIGK